MTQFHMGPPQGIDPAVAVGIPRAPHRPGWWTRNWKWAVPTGVGAIAACFIGFIALIIATVLGVIRGTEVYQTAVYEARSQPAVIGVLGVPIEEGVMVAGNIEVSPSSGYADLAIPIEGPGGQATIYVVAEKSGGSWAYSTLEVAVHDSGQTIDLLE
ncbi:MAG: hypothetical protein GY715_15390 [Planctomycetes bacterium]|nr:hypothetical protein [Planctomycetota bacterium]